MTDRPLLFTPADNVYSNTDNIQANLYYLDYMRLKNASEKADPKK